MFYFHLNEEFKKSLYHFNLGRRKKHLFLVLKVFLASFFIGFLLSSFLVPSSFLQIQNPDLSASSKHLKPLPSSKEKPLTFEIKKEETWKLSSLKKDSKGRANILFLGIPGDPWPGARLCDSIMVLSINSKLKKILVLSIPRDLLIKIPSTGWETRINALLTIEKEGKMIKEVVSEITGLEIHYFAILELASFERIIDTLGGVEVAVEKDIYDTRFPTPDRGYEIFSLKAGIQHLDGKTAMKYVRTRHEAQGDFARIQRQHQVIQAIFEKAGHLNLFADFEKIFKIFQEIRGEEKTNLGILELKNLASLSKALEKEKIKYFSLDAAGPEPLLVFGRTILGRNLAAVLWPQAGKFDYSKIKAKIEELTAKE